MNTIVQEINWPLRARQTYIQFFTLPLYVRVVLGIVMGFSAVSVGALALGGVGVPPLNPFAAYIEVLPGEPESAIDEQVFSCARSDTPVNPGAMEKHCQLNPAAGTFSAISVTISNQIIQQTTFIVRENTLRVGDVGLFIKSRDFRTVRGAAFFSWHRNAGIASTISKAGHFSLFDFIWQVTFTDTIYPPVSESRVDA